MIDNKLKPCPFCGESPVINPHGFYNKKTKEFTDKTYGIVCDNCHTSSWQFYNTKDEAIKAWNTRTPKERGEAE